MAIDPTVDGQLVHVAAWNSGPPVFGRLTEQGAFFRGQLDPGECFGDQRGRRLQCRAAAQPRPDRQVGNECRLKPLDRVTCVAVASDDAEHVVCPSFFPRERSPAIEGDHQRPPPIQGAPHSKLGRINCRGGAVHIAVDGGWHHQPALIVDVLANEIHAPGGEASHVRGSAEHFGERLARWTIRAHGENSSRQPVQFDCGISIRSPAFNSRRKTASSVRPLSV